MNQYCERSMSIIGIIESSIYKYSSNGFNCSFCIRHHLHLE